MVILGYSRVIGCSVLGYSKVILYNLDLCYYTSRCYCYGLLCWSDERQTVPCWPSVFIMFLAPKILCFRRCSVLLGVFDDSSEVGLIVTNASWWGLMLNFFSFRIKAVSLCWLTLTEGMFGWSNLALSLKSKMALWFLKKSFPKSIGYCNFGRMWKKCLAVNSSIAIVSSTQHSVRYRYHSNLIGKQHISHFQFRMSCHANQVMKWSMY